MSLSLMALEGVGLFQCPAYSGATAFHGQPDPDWFWETVNTQRDREELA
jgi:hypothetical protein